MYRGGALCYRDCNVIGMANCGIGACSLDGGSCASAIIGIIIDVVSGIVDLIVFVVSLGTSSALTTLKSTVKNGLKKIAQEGMKKAMKAAITAIKGQFTKVFIKKAIKKAQDFLKEKVTEGVTNTLVYTYCNTVANAAVEKTNSSVPSWINEDTLVSAVDFLGVKGMITSCNSETTSKDGGISCAKGVLGAASNFDPTGLLTIGAAFLFDTCDVPARLPEPIVDQAELGTFQTNTGLPIVNNTGAPVNGSVNEGCVQLWEHTNYGGASKVYCNESVAFTQGFNDYFSSMKVGPNTTVQVFEHGSYQGKDWLMEGGSHADFTQNGWNDVISSLKVARNADRAIIYEHGNYQGFARMYRKGEINGWVGDGDNDRYSSAKIGSNVSLVLYQHS
jgi:hypothetical protein